MSNLSKRLIGWILLTLIIGVCGLFDPSFIAELLFLGLLPLSILVAVLFYPIGLVIGVFDT